MLGKNKIMLFGALLILAFSSNNQGFSQSKSNISTQITAVYGSAASRLSSEQLSWLQNQIDRSSIKKITSTNDHFPLLSSLSLMNKYNTELQADDFSKPLSVNPLKYNIDFFNPEDQSFRIDGSEYILFVSGHKKK